ncbi:Ig-like domain-containing protein [Pseudoflavonifractor phocaeensis]|uniref:Ig-like domain-containing protein n=1 Tax=Pseudoflavonifractor phocaeensis TaxID=1870988 RepID=UPI001F3BEABA|nr:Ig-like domain-containing protein [Pseudoflavonifractor phocaeensis]MCF2661332.1 S-layer homology domain-containing protein [Pseudoflavonifractor phocaeensis]
MKRSFSLSRRLAALMALALVCTLSSPASAFFWNKKEDAPYVSDFSKNGLIGSIIAFEPEDFVVKTDNKATLNSITIDTLPDPGAGILVIGGQPLAAGAVVDSTALGGLRFQSSQNPIVTTTAFTFTPSFSSGQDSRTTTVTLYLLTQENQAPIARNMDLSTYKNIAITGYFDAVDSEGDLLSFELTSNPARGAVTMAEDGSSQFVYTPYENKTGSDSFTYVAVDPAGNTSSEAKVTVRIEKPDTKVTYADMEGSSAHKAAIRLAEEGVYVGEYMNGQYFFEPDEPVSRAQFLTMAMAVSGLEPMEDVTLTGFADDSAIPTWAKGSVSAALKAGTIQGSRDEEGAPVFGADQTVTLGEATVMLDRLLNITDVPAEVFFSDSDAHWAAQSAANLTASGILNTGAANSAALSCSLTRGEVAEMLDGALDVMAAREEGSWLPW